jgi:prolipoprotein diacylglyceryltransferase
VLSLPMVIGGIGLVIWAKRTNRPQQGHVAA